MTNSKSSASSAIFSLIFMIHLMNDAHFLNANGVGLLCPMVIIPPLNKMQASL